MVILFLLTNLRLASLEFKEKDMKLLEVYKYRNGIIYKIIYESIDSGYCYHYRNELTKSVTHVIGDKYTRVLRKDV